MTEQIYIDGAWRQPTTGETIPVYCPSDGREVARIGRGNAADVDAAVAAARRAFQGSWGHTPAVERGRLLSRLGEKIAQHAEDLAQSEAKDCGKPMTQARADMVATARYFEFYGAAADKVH